MRNGKLRIALIGLSFGAEFVPIYLRHPDVDSLVLVDSNAERLNRIGDKFLVRERISDYDEVLQDDSIDAVHLVTPIPLHADQSVAVLEAGKHCACTVPMATSLADIRRIVKAKRSSGKNYMMMETTLYTYQFLYVKRTIESGELAPAGVAFSLMKEHAGAAVCALAQDVTATRKGDIVTCTLLNRAYAEEKRFILHGCGALLSADLYRSDDVVPTLVFEKAELPLKWNGETAEIILPGHSIAQLRMKQE